MKTFIVNLFHPDGLQPSARTSRDTWELTPKMRKSLLQSLWLLLAYYVVREVTDVLRDVNQSAGDPLEYQEASWADAPLISSYERDYLQEGYTTVRNIRDDENATIAQREAARRVTAFRDAQVPH